MTNNRFPGKVTGIQGKGRNAKYAVLCDNGQEDKQVPGSSIRLSLDFDWAKDLEMCDVAEGDSVLARWQHPLGGKLLQPASRNRRLTLSSIILCMPERAGRKWYPGKVSGVNKDEHGQVMYTIAYTDGMEEKGFVLCVYVCVCVCVCVYCVCVCVCVCLCV
jgi:hypothetical protein